MAGPASKPDGGQVARAIGIGGVLAAALDFLAAMVIYKAGWESVGRAIAAGLLGAGAFEGGVERALLGVGLHLFISLVAAAVYVLASLRICGLRRRPLIGGALFGLCVFAVMNFIVVPLSAASGGGFDITQKLPDLAAHIVLFGLPVAFAARAVLGAPATRLRPH